MGSAVDYRIQDEKVRVVAEGLKKGSKRDWLHDIVDEALKEKRRFRRIPLDRNGRLYYPAAAQDAPCRLKDISTGGASLQCKLFCQPGDAAVLYLDDLGQFEGRITVVKKEVIAIGFTCSRRKIQNLADQLTIEINRHFLQA